MQFHAQTRRHQDGGILMVTFFVVAAIFVALGSYLLLIRAQYISIMRSEGWNNSLAMAEAGVEEAMGQLNPGAVATNISVNRSANGWGSAVNGAYGPTSRTVMSNCTYSVVFTDVPFPVIYSTGYVTLPDTSAVLKRTLRVGTTNVPLFVASLAARTNIDMNGNGLTSDSFNSSNTNLSTAGRYDSSKTSTNGDVAVLYGTLNPGNHNISGDVYMGPSATFSGNANQVSGTIYHDLNVDFPQVVAPNMSTWVTLATPILPINVLLGGILTPYDYVFNTSGDYVLSSGGRIYVAPGATVRLKILSGSTSKVTVDGSGSNWGNLTVYIAASSFSIGGQGFVDGGRAANLSYIGLPSNTSISLAGNAQFVGSIYAPNANVTLNGGGSNNYDFMGALIAASVTFTGHFMFHFDEDLLNHGPSRGYIAINWAEL